MTGCKSMIDAFTVGGDFHSRTAMGMYPEIAEAVKKYVFAAGVVPKIAQQ